MHTDLAVFFDVVFKHTPQATLLGLTTIKNNRTTNRTFRSTDHEGLANAIEQLAATTNIYLRITPLAHQPPQGKRGLERDSAGSSVLWCDLDCYDDKAQGTEALKSFAQPPTLIVDSGGGLHAYWQLDQFATDLMAIKSRNKWLYQSLATNDSDACYDLARVLRAPATYNLKHNPIKQAAIVHYDPTAIYPLETFPTEQVDDNSIVVWDHVPLPGTFAATIQETDRKLYAYLTDANKAAKMFTASDGTLDRSANDAYCVTRALSLGYTPEQCISLLTDQRYTTGQKYLATGRFDYVIITVNNCYNYFLNSANRYFNKSRFNAQEMSNTIAGVGDQFIFTADNIWRYDGGYYVRNADVIIKAEIVKRLKDRWNKHCEDETLNYIRAAYHVPIEQCNQRSDEFINCRNGMLSLSSGQLEPHDPNYRSLYQIPANYDPNVNTTFIDWFVNSIIPQDAIPFFWEYLGSSLLATQYWPKAFLLLVGAGDTGKSTMLRFVRAVLGSDNCSAITLQTLADNRFAVAKLYGKLANIFADLDETEAGNIGQIKAITGDDVIHGEEKFEKGFDFKPTARLIFSANNYPTIRNADQAFFNRAKLIRCSNQFKGKKADQNIDQKLTSPENLSAALLRMYEGLKRILAQKDFTASASMQLEHTAYHIYADSVVGFLNQCRYAPEFTISKAELYKAYSDACKFAHQTPVTEKGFYRRVSDNTARLGITDYKSGSDPDRVWVYSGIKPPTDVTTIYLVGAN